MREKNLQTFVSADGLIDNITFVTVTELFQKMPMLPIYSNVRRRNKRKPKISSPKIIVVDPDPLDP